MKRIGFTNSGMMGALFPFFLSFCHSFEKAAVLGGFLLHIWSIDETDAIAYNVRLYT